MEQGESSSTFPVFPVTYQPYQFIIKISDFCLDNWATIEKGKRLNAKGNYEDRKVNEKKLDSQELFYEMAYENADKEVRDKKAQ